MVLPVRRRVKEGVLRAKSPSKGASCTICVLLPFVFFVFFVSCAVRGVILAVCITLVVHCRNRRCVSRNAVDLGCCSGVRGGYREATSTFRPM